MLICQDGSWSQFLSWDSPSSKILRNKIKLDVQFFTCNHGLLDSSTQVLFIVLGFAFPVFGVLSIYFLKSLEFFVEFPYG